MRSTKKCTKKAYQRFCTQVYKKENHIISAISLTDLDDLELVVKLRGARIE